ncbi:MAG TPA: GAF domain-containing sensor histidine kinase [Anaerolineales bacterium]|nr:GAF domain-containing sensor histidine kinase [Anaerolineales bacterium]
MRSSDSPFITDWFTVSLRWLALLGLVISLSLGGGLFSPVNILLVAWGSWNIILTVLTGLNRRFRFHRLVGLSLDVVFAGAYFFLSGGFATPVFWVVYLPLFTAALYYEWRGSLITATLLTALQIAVVVSQPLSTTALIFVIGSSVFTFLLALGFGYIGVQLIRTIRRSRQAQLEAQQKKLRVENERLRAIYSLTSTLLATLNYQRVLESVLDLSLSALNTDLEAAADDRLICAVLLFSKEESLEVGSARRFTPADMRVVLRGRAGAISQAIDQDKPVLLKDVKNDPELTRFVALQRCKEIYCFPLRSGFNAYGVLLFGHPEQGYFGADRRDILDILGRQAVIAIQNARLYQDVVDERERMVEVQEEARKKLARDLHDGPTQSVSAIAMRINMAQRILLKDTKAAGEELGRIEELARRTTKEIRHMLFTLRPLVLESQGLTAALQSMADKMKETYSQAVIVAVEENVLKDLEIGKQGVIFYIVEEAATNARKHARAEHIWVNLRTLDKDIALLEVRDDGVGFDVAAVNRAYDQRGSLGMVNLRERTELVNGVLDLKSTPGKGTRVQVYIPLTEEAADRLHHAGGKK